jgi:ABC-2 type transport system ATP-binding protein
MGELTSTYTIEVEGMRKAYGKTVAVRNLSMHVPRGSVYGFVGPNGAGKTTTIRTLATLQRADAGTIRVGGIDVRKEPGMVRDRVGYMPDFFGVYDSLSVSEYLDFYGSSHRLSAGRRRQICHELLELVDLSEKRDAPVESLSRGMKQRLGLARCLVHDPDVLLLDEPASGMDPRARIELREILRELARLNKTILISSHILPELAEMCTHVGIIRDGELLAEGTVEEVTQSLAGGGHLRVRVLDDSYLEAAEALLSAHPACSAVEIEGTRALVAAFNGDEDDLAALLSVLVSEHVAVTGYTVEGSSLEDIFLQITEPLEDTGS